MLGVVVVVVLLVVLELRVILVVVVVRNIILLYLSNTYSSQICDLDAFNIPKMTKITPITMKGLRWMRPGYKVYYNTNSPSKHKGLFL